MCRLFAYDYRVRLIFSRRLVIATSVAYAGRSDGLSALIGLISSHQIIICSRYGQVHTQVNTDHIKDQVLLASKLADLQCGGELGSDNITEFQVHTSHSSLLLHANYWAEKLLAW